MLKQIQTLAAVSVIALSSATLPALAESNNTTSGAAASNPSNPAGFGSAYNYSLPKPMGEMCCKKTYDHKNADGNATIIMGNFNQKLAAMQLAIIEALRLGTGQISGNMREQTGAEHTLADQQDDRATVKAVEEARLAALVDATSGTTSCYVATGSGGGSLQGSSAVASQSYDTELDKWVRGETPYSKDGPEASSLFRLAAYCNKYGTKVDVETELCKNVGPLPGASVVASESLFHKGESGVDYTYSEDRAEATNSFIVNTLAPVTYALLSPAESQSPEGRLKASRMKSQMARESVGRSIVTEYAKSRDPQSSGGTLKSWAKARLSKMQGMENVDAENLSYQQWLAIYGKGFLLDTETLMASDQNSVTALKDIKNMMAVLNYIAYEQLEQQQKANVQLAVISAILNEQTRTDGVFALSTNQ